MTLYGRRGCPLCDEMTGAVVPRLAAQGIKLQTVDIDSDPKLTARFDWDVPLLFDGEHEICRHEFDAVAFEVWLLEV